MNKIITTLFQNPHYENEVLSLIEKSFHYNEQNNFKIDFYPLMNEQNWNNLYLYIIDNKVCAHVGILPQVWMVNGNRIPVLYMGGIAVDEKFRGQGLFKELFEHIFKVHKHYALYLLWSDQVEMYNKFGFHLALEQIEIAKSQKSDSQFELSKLKNLSDKELNEINDLYNNFWNEKFIYSFRDLDYWKKLSFITSTELYYKKTNSVISDYFFMNKGADLPEIIFEFASNKNLQLTEMSQFGKVWLPSMTLLNSDTPYETQFGCLMKVGSENHFHNFVSAYTNGEMEFLGMNAEEVFFKFKDENLSLPIQDFLTGLMGPGVFEEFQEFHKPVFISGLDSI
jgi:hypothetical protein